MRGDNRTDSKEGLALREREGTSFPCRSNPNAPQAKPVSLGSIKSTGGVESAPGTIQRFVVKTRRIRRIAPRDLSPEIPPENEVNESGLEVDSASNDDEDCEARIGDNSQENKENDENENLCAERDSRGGEPVENGPFVDDAATAAECAEDSSDVNHNKRRATSGASSGSSGRSSGTTTTTKSYDWFDECEREEQQIEVRENGIDDVDDPWTDDNDEHDEEAEDLSDAAKFMSSIRKCAKMSEREDRLRNREDSDNGNVSRYYGTNSGSCGSEPQTKVKSDYSKGAIAKSKYYAQSSSSDETNFDRHCSIRSPRSRHHSDSRSGYGDDVESLSGPTSRNSFSDNSEPVLSPPYSSSGTRSHRNTNNKPCYHAEASRKGSNSSTLKELTVSPRGRHSGDNRIELDSTTGTRTSTTDRSHDCDYADELDSDKVVSHASGDKIRDEGLPERRRSNNERTDYDSGDSTRTGTKVLQSQDKQYRRKALSVDLKSSGITDNTNSESNNNRTATSASTRTAHSLPKTVTFAKSVKSADDEDDDDEIDEDEEDVGTDEDICEEDSSDECRSVNDNVSSSRQSSGGGGGSSKIAGESYNNNGNRTKRSTVGIVKRHTVSTADLDNDPPIVTGPTAPPPLQQRPRKPTFHYMGAPPTFSHHLHPPVHAHSAGAVGSASNKRRYLSLPLLEQDSSEVDSCSSTDVSPGDSSGTGSATGSSSVPLTYTGTRLLNPGEVYYFAPNSCVVCVERSKLTPARIQVRQQAALSCQ